MLNIYFSVMTEFTISEIVFACHESSQSILWYDAAEVKYSKFLMLCVFRGLEDLCFEIISEYLGTPKL